MSTAENPNVDFNDALVTSIKVEIDAPASLVWDILIDMPKYGEWNPFCIECDSTLEMGAPVNMKLKSYITPDEVFDNCEFICAFEPEKMISWELPYSDEWPYPRAATRLLKVLALKNVAIIPQMPFLAITAFMSCALPDHGSNLHLMIQHMH